MLHKSKVLLILFLGLILVSCSEDTNNDIEVNQIKSITQDSKRAVDSCFEIADSNNPYNYVGELHNEILNEFIRNHSEQRLSVEETIVIVEKLAKENPRFLDLKEAPVDPSDIYRGINDFGNNFHKIVDVLEVSSDAKSDLKTVFDYLFENGYSEQQPNFNNIQQDLLQFEKKALENRSYTRSERKIILSAISTARYSTCYWYNYYISKRVSGNSFTSKRPWWNWVVIAVADVGGTIAGGGVNVGTGVSASGLANTLTNPKNK